MSLGAERCVTSSHLWESRASNKGKCGKTNIGACTAEKKSSLGLGRVPAAHTLFSRGCSPKTSETLVAPQRSGCDNSNYYRGGLAGSCGPESYELGARAHLRPPQPLGWEGAGPCPQTPN